MCATPGDCMGRGPHRSKTVRRHEPHDLRLLSIDGEAGFERGDCTRARGRIDLAAGQPSIERRRAQAVPAHRRLGIGDRPGTECILRIGKSARAEKRLAEDRLARRTRLKCPSCSAPIVGTTPTDPPALCSSRTANRISEIVEITRGEATTFFYSIACMAARTSRSTRSRSSAGSQRAGGQSARRQNWRILL